MPKLRLSKRADGWWVVGHPHWNSEDEAQGPYPVKKEAQEAKLESLRFYRENPRCRDPMWGYEWRVQNLVKVWNVAEGDTGRYTRELGGDRLEEKRKSLRVTLRRQSSFGRQLAPREWTNKSKAELEKLGIFGFQLGEKQKVTIVVPPAKKGKVASKIRKGKVRIIVPAVPRKKQQTAEPSWEDLGLSY